MTKMLMARPDFAKIRQSGAYYSDKTGLLCDLAQQEMSFFLSRPRRFGKTLLVSTLDYMFQGRVDLFKGLEIESRGWDWTPRPVIKLEMNRITSKSLEDMEQALRIELNRIAKNKKIDVIVQGPSPSMLGILIDSLYEKYEDQNVAILIDEYDAPIIRHLTDPERATAIRDQLAEFYGVLKSTQEMLGFVFVTGVSRFSKASIFSALNDPKDLTIGGRCAEICGLTEADIGKLIEGHKDNMLKSLVEDGSLPKGATPEDLRRLIQDWYDGYSWDGVTRVYNPWSVLNCFQDAMISSYWYKSATPSFLYDLVETGKIDFDITKNIKNINDNDTFIHKIDQINAEGLLFQTGYLTIENTLPGRNSYSLRFPNLEVSASLPPLLLNIPPPDDPIAAKRCAESVVKALFELNGPKLEESFKGYLNTYPLTTFNIRLEQNYHTLLISCMHLANQVSRSCEMTSIGILDMLIEHNNDNYIIEVKFLSLRNKDRGDNKDEPPSGKKESAASRAKEAEIEYELPKTPEEWKALRDKMAQKAKDALEQIETKYAPKYANELGRLIKVALVVAKRTEVYVEIVPSGPRRP